MEPIFPESDIQLEPGETPEIPLPKGWTSLTLQAILHIVALTRLIILNAGNWPEGCDGLRLRAENDRLRAEVNMLQREITIKNSRFARLDPKKRPHYLPTERLEILAIRAMRGWSNAQVAKRFHVTVQTVINWIRGVDNGEETVQLPERVNRYPDFVRYCPGHKSWSFRDRVLYVLGKRVTGQAKIHFRPQKQWASRCHVTFFICGHLYR